MIQTLIKLLQPEQEPNNEQKADLLPSACLVQNGMLNAGPVRLQRSRQHKQVSPNGLPIIYVGRPGKWGNPFRVSGQKGHWFVLNDNDELLITFNEKLDAIDFCIENYKYYILNEMILGTRNPFELKGKNLACWCSLNCKCHADVLLEIANR
jgi:hypothetical protein